tara:strand:- start:919 stop:1173 length:255 start_codon:yes stop_codon:yes gene_type:complete
MKLAVVIDVDGDIMYVPENTHGFINGAKPKLFNNLRDAEEERCKWNTGVIVDYETGKSVPTIKSFTDDERARAKEREAMNDNNS